MFRTAVTAAAVIATMSVLAACGPVQMGAAAIVGGHRISAAMLATEVARLDTANKTAKAKVPVQFPPSQAPQQVLSWLVRFQVRDQLAVRSHISVSRGESQRALAQIAAQARGSGITAPLSVLAAANGLPPDLLPDLGRYQAIQNAVISRLDGGVLPSTPAAQQALGARFGHQECLAAKSLHIRINPQFGRLDYRGLSVILAPPTLSAPQSPAPAPTPSPQLSPAC